MSFALALLAVVPSPAVAGRNGQSKPCRVGEPTSWHTSRFGRGSGIRFRTQVLVLACGRTGFLGAPVEIVGYNTSGGLCTSTQVPEQMIVGAICWPAGITWHTFWSGAIHLDGIGWAAGGSHPTASNLTGEVDPNVAEVEVRFHREGEIWVKRATVAQVDGDLLAALGQPEPFGLFAAILPGCVPPRGVRVVARDSNGRFLGARRGTSPFAHPCHPLPTRR